MRTLTQRELNRALLARQLLLERGRMPLPKALERIGGIQAQYAPSMYIGLCSRVDGFTRDVLDRAREAYVHHVYGADANDLRHYHLAIDTTALSLDCVVDLIARAAERD